MLVEDLAAEINGILESYADDVQENVAAQMEPIIGGIAEELRNTSNRSKKESDGYKKYADGWTYGKEKYFGGQIFTVYNETKPTLTHLLEFGWLNTNGVVPGNAHISKAFEKYQQILIDTLTVE